jgi:hypothetical protein
MISDHGKPNIREVKYNPGICGEAAIRECVLAYLNHPPQLTNRNSSGDSDDTISILASRVFVSRGRVYCRIHEPSFSHHLLQPNNRISASLSILHLYFVAIQFIIQLLFAPLYINHHLKYNHPNLLDRQRLPRRPWFTLEVLQLRSNAS